MSPSSSPTRLTRRGLLLGTAALAAVSTLAAAPGFAAAAANQLQDFMQLSRLLVPHRLDPAVGARIADFAAQAHPDLQATVGDLLQLAAGRKAARVEDFWADIPAGAQKDLASWIIFAWYTGSSDKTAKAAVFTYEKALMFQTTADLVTIPSFGAYAPNGWSRPAAAIDAVPTF